MYAFPRKNMKNEEIFLDILEAIEDNTTFVEADKIKVAYSTEERRYSIAANRRLYPMDDGAVETVKAYAGILGNAFKKMSPGTTALVLNKALDTKKGGGLLYNYMGKVLGVLSSRYEILPIDTIYGRVTRTADELGGYTFIGGETNPYRTSCELELPNLKGLARFRGSVPPETLETLGIPVIRFRSSNIGDLAVHVQPGFLEEKTFMPYTNGIHVVHKNQNDASAYERMKELDELFSLFIDSVKEVEALKTIEIEHPENTVISVCRRYVIPKKWGKYALEAVESMAACCSTITAYDIYTAMCCIPAYAQAMRKPQTTIDTLEEKIARVRKAAWEEHDVGGHVAWSAKEAQKPFYWVD